MSSFLYASPGYFHNTGNVYITYIKQIIKEKNLKKEDIKKYLNQKHRTLTGNMLKAIYYDYEKRDINTSKKYYEEILLKSPTKIYTTIDGIYMADYLLRTKREKEVLNFINIDYCEILFSKYKKPCFNILYQAKASLNIYNEYEKRKIKQK
jgi:hypothetical protein